MTDVIEQRDFFISFNSADRAYAEAIDNALRGAGFSTFYHPRDLPAGGNVPIWMDDALMSSAQTLALYSPDYTKDKAIYSKAERYASWWQDPGGDKRKLIPVLLRETSFTPLMATVSRVEVTGLTPKDAAARLVERLKNPKEAKERDRWRLALPLPKTFNVLYRHNPNFTGRFEAMESLQKSLREGNAAITALAGMGGVGKTTLAAEYCHRFGGRYGGVWWVRAEQESVMVADLATLGGRIGIAASGNVEADARAALDYLASRTEPWLMIYDNAPDPDTVGKWLPAGAVRCIITSRFAGFDGIATVTRLDQWSDEVTADYLLARTGRDDKTGALRLAHTLGGLPLAAEQAAVHLRPRAGTSFDEYASDIAALIKRPRPKGASGDYPDTVYAAFAKSLETLERSEGGEIALDLVRLCAFLSPDGVDLSLLMADKDGKVMPNSFAKAIANKSAREDALAALVSLSLMRQENGPFGPILIFHRLLLEVVRDWIGADARDLWGSAAVRLVNGAFPSNVSITPSTWPLCARLMPHIAPVTAHALRVGVLGKALSRLLNQASAYLRARGDRAGALALAEKSVALGRATSAAKPVSLAATIGNLAGLYAEFDRLDEAEAAHREALTIKETNLPPQHPSLAVTFSNLAEVYWRRKQFVEAEPLLLRAAEIDKAGHGAESAKYGTRLANLGTLYSTWALESGQAERLTPAENYATQARTVVLSAYGGRHPEVATSHSNLAHIKVKLGDWPKATEELERAVAIMLSLDLAQHPKTQHTAIALANCWQHSGKPDKAARLKAGDISDLLPAIAQIEAEHRAWVAKDPENRHFGPRSPFEKQKK